MNLTILCGGIGAAKLLQGFAELDSLEYDLNITAVVNTADDDYFYGFRVCPDLDSIVYHLANINDPIRGWGRKNETFNFVNTLRDLGVDAWFNLGDKDLALNKIRTDLLKNGCPLTQATNEISKLLKIEKINVLPMTDIEVQTSINSLTHGRLTMQEYFVREKCNPQIQTISYLNIPNNTTAQVREAILKSDHILIAPSNPFLSIFPILEIQEISNLLREHENKVCAISPLVNGDSVKGPLSKILKELGFKVNNSTIANLYSGFISDLVVNSGEEPNLKDLGSPVLVHSTETYMDNLESKTKLAEFLVKDVLS